MYQYKATLDRVIDGDTVDVFIDLGFRIITHQRLRIKEIDTPELRSKSPGEREHAQEAKLFVENLFWKYSGECYVQTTKTGKYGRWIASVRFGTGDPIYLHEALKEAGFEKKERYD
jgi:micrococcal nuclease